ncbi:MAG: DUF1648 domain-containing protein [Terriglobales bacterium]|jgi:uncharacterized membrane protein
MRAGWKPLYAWMVVVLLHAAQTIYYYPRLPAVVAQHFGAQGNPNGWAPREFFFGFSWVVLLGVSALLMLTPRLLGRLPVAMINLPNKAYWLAPERKQESLEFLQRGTEWIGVLTSGFLVVVMNLAIRANLAPDHRLDNSAFIPLLVTFIALMLLGSLRVFLRFARPV